MKLISTLAATGAVLLSISVGVSAATDPIKARQAAMKNVLKSVKTVKPMLQGKAAYDAAAAKAALEAMAASAKDFPMYFPEDSAGDPDSEASDRIWEKMDDFKKLAAKLEGDAKAAAAAAEGGLDAFKGKMATVFSNCKGCHESYRIKKQK